MRIGLFTTFLLSLSSLCNAGVRDLTCDPVAPGQYRLAFTLDPGTKSVRIFASDRPDRMEGAREIAHASKSPVEVKAGAPGERVYFHVKPDQGPVRVVSIRRLPLEGTPNFRDLGGYPAADGRFVKWGILYRSGVLAGLTDADYGYLSQLGVHVVCDFRTDDERTTSPTRWRGGSSPEFALLSIGSNGSGKGSSVSNIGSPNDAPAQLRERMVTTYQSFAMRASDSYRSAFARLRRGELPLLAHCTAGKDRTGVFSALLLTALGVPREIVLADYELTNRALQDNQENQRRLARLSGSSTLSALMAEQSRPLIAADRAYLEAMFQALDREFGSFDNYRRTALDISDEELVLLRNRLLER